MKLRVWAAVPLAVVLIGCGNDAPRPDAPRAQATQPETTGASQAATEPTIDTSRDDRIAEQALLKLRDFPSGWTADDENDPDPADCEAINDTIKQATARDGTPGFRKGDYTLAQHVVAIFSDEATAERSFEQYASRDTRACLGEELARSAADDSESTVGDASTAELNVPPAGDEIAAARITIPFASDDIEVDVNIDIVMVRTARALSLLVFAETFSTFDDGLRDELTDRAAQRLAIALGN